MKYIIKPQPWAFNKKEKPKKERIYCYCKELCCDDDKPCELRIHTETLLEMKQPEDNPLLLPGIYKTVADEPEWEYRCSDDSWVNRITGKIVPHNEWQSTMLQLFGLIVEEIEPNEYNNKKE